MELISMTGRIAPAEPPFDPEIQIALDKLMPPGVPPLVLFTTLARDKRLFQKLMRSSLLDKGNLTLRQREIVICRTTALCGSEYEWGVHIAFFGDRVGFSAEQTQALVKGHADDAVWNAEERLLISVCDELHSHCNLSDEVWKNLQSRFSSEATLEILMLAGFYRTVSYLTNALRLPLEAFASRFPRDEAGDDRIA
jgi:alkylhydroperoxidase family enzyme